MKPTTDTAQALASAWRPGLRFHNRANAGVVVETTADHHLACARHERVLAFVDDCAKTGTRHPGGLLLLQHATDNLVLSGPALWLATGKGAVAYASGDDHYLEWTDEHGWIDRRRLSPATVASIHALGSWWINRADRLWAAHTLRQLVPEARGQHVWTAFLSDAQAWWHLHASGPLRDHALGLRRLQLLTRAELARGVSGCPQAPAVEDEPAPLLPDMAQFPESGRRTGGIEAVTELRVFAAAVAKDRPSKVTGREAVVDRINLLLPLAAAEGQACLHALGAFRHALLAGGALGRLWAPVTIVEYLREGLEPLVHEMNKTNPDALDGATWHALYLKAMQAVGATQRKKFSAFIQVFHRFMVIAGAEPLPWPLLSGEPLLPPAAAVVHLEELDAALRYIDARAPSEQVRLQARIILRLGWAVPMRTYEFWCLRVGDVQGGQDLSLVIYPRLVDGICKSPYVRRVEDIHELALRRDLLALQRLRRESHALDEDVLFGVAGQPLARHREQLTNAFVNTALRWATGKRQASTYDLRHTCFSRLAAATL
jgi:integrase